MLVASDGAVDDVASTRGDGEPFGDLRDDDLLSSDDDGDGSGSGAQGFAAAGGESLTALSCKETMRRFCVIALALFLLVALMHSPIQVYLIILLVSLVARCAIHCAADDERMARGLGRFIRLMRGPTPGDGGGAFARVPLSDADALQMEEGRMEGGPLLRLFRRLQAGGGNRHQRRRGPFAGAIDADFAARHGLNPTALRLAMLDRDFNGSDYEMLQRLDDSPAGGASDATMNPFGFFAPARRGLPQSQIERLPSHCLPPDAADAGAAEAASASPPEPQPQRTVRAGSAPQKKCAICLDIPSGGAHVRTLPCLHQFHRECIDRWLRSKATCPVCNFDLAQAL